MFPLNMLFVYRELPQEIMGFSPFELSYGQSPREPLKLLKEAFVKGDVITDAKDIHTYESELPQ